MYPTMRAHDWPLSLSVSRPSAPKILQFLLLPGPLPPLVPARSLGPINTNSRSGSDTSFMTPSRIIQKTCFFPTARISVGAHATANVTARGRPHNSGIIFSGRSLKNFGDRTSVQENSCEQTVQFHLGLSSLSRRL